MRPLLLTSLCLLAAACSPARGVPILLWHSVGEGSPADEHDLGAEEFDRELGLIDAWGAKTVTLDQVLDAATGGARLPERAVVLTFDDGRACLKTSALPILAKRQMVAELFVVTDRIAADEAHRFVERDEAGAHPYLTWPELGELAASGRIHIQSHSKTHRRHTELTVEQMREELVASRREITARLGVPVNFFAYPYGGFNTPYRTLVDETGYRGGLAVEKGPGTPFAMLRQSLLRGNEDVLVKVLTSAFGSRPAR